MVGRAAGTVVSMGAVGACWLVVGVCDVDERGARGCGDVCTLGRLRADAGTLGTPVGAGAGDGKFLFFVACSLLVNICDSCANTFLVSVWSDGRRDDALV